MNQHEEQQMLSSLTNGLSALVSALQGVSPESSVAIPAPGKWSILQCVEHVALSEDFLFSRILAAEQTEAPLLNAEREARIAARGTDRTKPAEAPEPVRPRGVFATVDEALQHLLASRERTLQFVREHARDDLRCWIASVPPFGTLNCQEVLMLMAAHLFRHTMQMQEIEQSLCLDRQN
jgi:uncharacterized damage-inducible protein DinB